MVLLSAAIGLIAGLGAIVFQFLCHTILEYGLAGITGFAPSMPAGEPGLTAPGHDFLPWLLVLVMAGGGLVSGWIVYTFAPEAEGHGTDAAIEAFHHKRGERRARAPLVKLLASAVTIGTGGEGTSSSVKPH